MHDQRSAPHSTRAKFVFFVWNNLPRLLLLAIIVLIVVLAVVIKNKSALIASDKAAGLKQERPPVNVVTLLLQPTVIRDRINLPGSIEAWTALSLFSKLNGTVVEVVAREGQVVKKGDVLARIDDDDYRIAVQRARAAYDLARAEFERDRAIFAKGVIPAAEYDANRTRMETARADLANAELQLSRCTVTAPMHGIVRRLDAKVGLQLAVGDLLAEILEIDRLKAVVGIPESEVAAVRGLTAVDISLQALQDRTVAGTVHFLSASPETLARLFRLELAVDNPDGDILPGMFFRADVVKKTVPDAIVIPFYSVISRNDEQYVYVEEDGVVARRPVEIGIMEQWMVQVTSGLRPGDRLVVEGHRDVEDGQKVKIVRAATAMKDLMP
ncbi:efflux RND transporter periplasmic adaptor subunit [Desulfoprunum benzoelyticum]|uniref:Membrane fusion protein (Multidrug efflux system) n=1 Tax=Desulfoprunum benzoelyticum TaxID=1506996 RepID=A0A840USE6_9BACT|nr:efflux RND transporter periplasmic adaptor subunit [Desulfoprunum benzoelyticum]MBB5349137.1 membrane fusion protein (multidrug efflux system) [Desulfoprunum benzoelyticum]MBM9530625.1 efflux RND transporter periplasmic adaptor subunit [Desulfoprunum benzoelyticum]